VTRKVGTLKCETRT